MRSKIFDTVFFRRFFRTLFYNNNNNARKINEIKYVNRYQLIHYNICVANISREITSKKQFLYSFLKSRQNHWRVMGKLGLNRN